MKPIRVALIPAHCPGEILTDLVQELSMRDFFIVVVNDGSGSEYEPLFNDVSLCAVVLTHHEAQGRGASIRTALTYLRQHFPFHYTIVTMDADGKYRLGDAEHICRIAEENRGAFVLGARIQKGQPLRTRLSCRLSSFWFKLTTGASVGDTTTGLRAFSDELVPQLLELGGEQNQYEKRVLTYCARKHIPLAEVKVRTVQYDQ